MTDAPSLIEHLERYLGPIQAGSRLSASVQGVCFHDRPVRGAVTYSTLGLSHHVVMQNPDNPCAWNFCWRYHTPRNRRANMHENLLSRWLGDRKVIGPAVRAAALVRVVGALLIDGKL